MKSAFTLLILLFAIGSSQAATITQFTCTTDNALLNGKKYAISFRVQGLGTRSIEALETRKDSGIIVAVTPKNGEILLLNENFGMEQTSKYLELRGDGDGFELVYLHLYADRGLTSGYLKLDNQQDKKMSQYVTVSCELK